MIRTCILNTPLTRQMSTAYATKCFMFLQIDIGDLHGINYVTRYKNHNSGFAKDEGINFPFPLLSRNSNLCFT